MEQTLFLSADLAVRQVVGFAPACCVVTFDSFTDDRRLERPGFGQAFFASRGIDAVHVISRENDWYQYAEMREAMAAVHAATRGYQRVIAYGSSMGAYAAIRLAGLAGANCVLALSPQFSIDRRLAWFENRWAEASRRFKPVWERRLRFPKVDEAYVIYDPRDFDGRHAALLKRSFAFRAVPLPESGHTVSGFLQEIGLLQSVVLAACAGTLDVPAVIAEAWRLREQSPQHFRALAQQTNDPVRRLAFLADAVRVAPEDAGCLTAYAVALSQTNRIEEALALHRRAVAAAPSSPSCLAYFSHTLEKSGDVPGALAAMEAVSAMTGGASLYADRLRGLRARLAGGRSAAAERRGLLAWRRTVRALRPLRSGR